MTVVVAAHYSVIVRLKNGLPTPDHFCTWTAPQAAYNGGMADTVNPVVRSRMMAAIRAKNTKPELAVRRGLHALGFRYLLHSARFPGKPDILLPKYQAVLWLNGCFWHGHNCPDGRIPTSRADYWGPKISRTRERDKKAIEAVQEAGWRSLVIWECAFRRKGAAALERTVQAAACWIVEGAAAVELSGTSFGTGTSLATMPGRLHSDAP